MAMRRLIHVDNFDNELVTNVDKGDLPLNSATKFENIRADKPGLMRGIPGYKSFADGITAIDGNFDWFEEVVLNDTQVLLAWGSDGSVQHFYYSTDGGTTWIEITEVHQDTLDGGTTSPDTSFVITTGNANIATGWIVFVQGDTTWDYVNNYVHGTKTVTTKYGVGTFADDTALTFLRYPLWDNVNIYSDTFADQRNLVPTGFKPSLVQRQEAVAIYTGKTQDNITPDEDTGDWKNLWFGHVTTGNIFDDSDLSYTGYQAEMKYPAGLVTANIVSSLSTSSTQDNLPDATWGVFATLLYDGYQDSDSRIFVGTTVFNLIPDANVQATVSQALVVNYSWDRFPTLVEMVHQGTRRATAIRTWMAQVQDIATPDEWEATTPFFLVNETDITDTAWAGGGASAHTLQLTIYGRDWNAAQRSEFEFMRGHFSRLWSNADFGVEVSGREIVGSLLFADNKGSSFPTAASVDQNEAYIIPTPINAALRNTPDATAVSSIVNMGEHGIYKIRALDELSNRLVVFGENNVMLMAFDSLGNLVPVENFKEVGIKGYWSTHSTGRELFWGNLESIYLLGRAGTPQEIGFAIRGDWQALSANNRNNAIATHNKVKNEFILHSPSGTTYIFDREKRTWRTYVTTLSSIEWITAGVDGEVLASDGTDIYELFPASGSTESVTSTYEKEFDFDNYLSVDFFELAYKSSALITVKIFDLEEDASNYPVAEIKYFPSSDFNSESRVCSFRAKRFMVQITVSSTTDPDWEVYSYSIFGDAKELDT